MDNDPAVIFDVLADPTRRHVVQLLSTGPCRAGDIAASAGVSAAVMSRHLRLLLRAGLVTDERTADDARVRLFRLRPQSLAGLQAWLDQLRAQWSEQLQSFKSHVESR